LDSDGRGSRDCGGGEDKDVGDVGEHVGEDDEGHGGVDDAGEVTVGGEEFADDVIGVIPAIKGPKTGVKGDGPVGGVGGGAGEPGGGFPVGFG